jgi:GNAT superfamily N-acetyltransferase
MQVDCDLRSQGIGKMMLDNGEEYAKSIGASRLRTMPEDERSHNFYRKNRYVDTDTIYTCVCSTVAGSVTEQCGAPAAVTLDIANSHEFVFGLWQSSGRHMYEVANHNPEPNEFTVKTIPIPEGYLQFRYKEGETKALALYWSNKEVTPETVAAILAFGHAAGLEEIEFVFKTKYKNLFAAYNPVGESTEIERGINCMGDTKNLQHIRINLEHDRDYILERHCRINYACDCPWAREISYEEYRTNWFSNSNQQEGFLSALCDSMEDERTIAEIIKTEQGETIGFIWVPFYGGDANFIWADVQDIYVEETYRGSGIAAYLMEYAEKSARVNGAKVIRSGTGCDNIASQKLHQKLGHYQYRMEYEKVLREDV